MKSLLSTFYASFVTCLMASITVFACEDKNAKSCQDWAKQKQCTRNSAYMHKWCKKSCGLCVPCVDKNKHCEYWSGKGHCTGKNRAFMSKNCRRSCGMCTCKDIRKECGQWKGQGYCTRSAAYMKSNCPQTCGMCDASQWSTWGSWWKCSKSCGKGEKRRERICAKGKCKGFSFQTEQCNLQPCVALGNSQCGQQNSPTFSGIGRVVGGKGALQGEFPWQVGLVKANRGAKPPSNQLPFCGGTLIKANVVLTAAHCFRTVRYAKDFFVRVGDHDMNTEGAYEKTIAVRKLIKHENFDIRTYKADIALVVLNEAVSLNNHVNIACLPDKNINISPCTVTGWGRTTAGGVQAQRLQKAQLPIVTRSVCNTAYKKIFPDRDVIGENMICAGYEGGLIDACQGDSGGPLVCKQSGKYVLNGIVSWGVGCAEKGRYGVYTNTYKYMDWIESQLNEIRKETSY